MPIPDVAPALSGLRRGVLTLLLLVAVAMLVVGLATGYPPVAVAAVPFAVFAWATSQALRERFAARELALRTDAPPGGGEAARPGLTRAAGWAVLAVVALGVAAAILQSG